MGKTVLLCLFCYKIRLEPEFNFINIVAKLTIDQEWGNDQSRSTSNYEVQNFISYIRNTNE